MATFRQNLISRRDDIGVELAEVQNTDRHIQYKQGLYEELLVIEQLLHSSATDQGSGDTFKPFEIETQGFT